MEMETSEPSRVARFGEAGLGLRELALE